MNAQPHRTPAIDLPCRIRNEEIDHDLFFSCFFCRTRLASYDITCPTCGFHHKRENAKYITFGYSSSPCSDLKKNTFLKEMLGTPPKSKNQAVQPATHPQLKKPKQLQEFLWPTLSQELQFEIDF
eukprot:Awhi_evm2s8969